MGVSHAHNYRQSVTSTLEVQLRYGIRDGNPVHISAITPEFNGDKCGCVCPACGKGLRAKTLGKTDRAIHFAHRNASDCNAESIVHWTAKYLLEKRIRDAIHAARELLTDGNCKSCGGKFTVDLAKEAMRVEVEKRLDLYIPDLTTFDSNGKPLLLIEVVHTNPPSWNKLEYARTVGHELIEFKVDDDDDLRDIEKGECLAAHNLTPCRSSRCGLFDMEVNSKVTNKSHEQSSESGKLEIENKLNEKNKSTESSSNENAIQFPVWLMWLIGIILSWVLVSEIKKKLKYLMQVRFNRL